MAHPELSMVIPVRDEIEAVDSLVSRLSESLEMLDVRSFEVIFVDDGSTDGTAERLEWLTIEDDRYSLLRLRRPSGKRGCPRSGIRKKSR